jgi:hypothetical protein
MLKMISLVTLVVFMFVLTFLYVLLCVVDYVMDIIVAVLSTLTNIIFTFISFIFISACVKIIKQVLVVFMFVLTYPYVLLRAVNYVMDFIVAVLSTLTSIIFTFIFFIFMSPCAIIIKQFLKFCYKFK